MKEMNVVCDRCKKTHTIRELMKKLEPGERWGFLQGYGTFVLEVPRKPPQPRSLELCPKCAALFLAWLAQPPTVEVVITEDVLP